MQSRVTMCWSVLLSANVTSPNSVSIDERPAPEACETMVDVRKGVDAIDRALVTLLSERQRYMDAAARIKPNREAVFDQARIDDVIAKVLNTADKAGLSAEIAEPVWRLLIESSIAHEFATWDETRG